MSRPDLIYAAPVAPAAPVAGFDPDMPIAGYYRMRLRSGAVWVAIRVWFGPPLNHEHADDPTTARVLDRSHRWQATANGEIIPLDRVWPQCADDPIDKAEARRLVELQRWGAAEGHDVVADPTRRADPNHTPIPF
ncbi:MULTISPECIES: hypothetical protein [unclassified Sphingomonas]|uniref:hypothetical protein n=1 Tax=unclassified Sphingomonas TaxID=196159 RepID=UPI0006F5A04A|nr:MULTISPECIES: hypothetical protein [unclassified Sphingomonas]KQX18382.1 hypothetical protein ASD17_14570 [Sphingomonas sp. Root1294]KQY72293.1 hypothetical protein ASD39_20405 [Sphingomonas sp. Root50]KRB94436.1 hypothetical protein ASE22_00345 [Sphingomonas sp. Root720]